IMTFWSGVVAPAGTPASIVDTLNGAINKGLGTDAIRETLTKFGATTNPGSPQDFARFIAAETVKGSGIANTAGITAQRAKNLLSRHPGRDDSREQSQARHRSFCTSSGANSPSISTKQITHGAPERLLQAWLVPHWTTTSPASSSTSTSSSTIVISPDRM